MSDIFREVEEEVRRERFEKLWKEYGDYVIAAAALLIIGVAGWQFWQHYEAQQALKASDAYIVAEQMLQGDSQQSAEDTFAKLAKDAPGGYAKVARLQEANALLASGRTPEALSVYREIAAGSDPLLSALAKLRIAWATVETAPRAEIESLLAPLADPASPWRYSAREILAYQDYKLGQYKRAIAEFQSLGADKATPLGIRQRSMAMAVFLKAGGGQDVGTVPPPPKPPLPAGVNVTGAPAPSGTAPQ